jgi:excisionase family DNA binding protein
METLLTIRELMKLTSESESAWRKRLGRREIPFIRLGANVRVRRADFEAWLSERTVSRKEPS